MPVNNYRRFRDHLSREPDEYDGLWNVDNFSHLEMTTAGEYVIKCSSRERLINVSVPAANIAGRRSKVRNHNFFSRNPLDLKCDLSRNTNCMHPSCWSRSREMPWYQRDWLIKGFILICNEELCDLCSSLWRKLHLEGSVTFMDRNVAVLGK